MWLFTTRGFYSAVEKPEDRQENMITIRSRTKADLERLSDLIDAKPYRQSGYTDYPWRLRCKKDEWAVAVYAMAEEIDYSNFKNRVKTVLGAHRASVYGRIWGVLLDLESKSKKWGQSDFGFGGHVTESQTDGKCRYCNTRCGDTHIDTCEKWAGFRCIASDCTRKPAKRARSRKRSGKGGKAKAKA